MWSRGAPPRVVPVFTHQGLPCTPPPRLQHGRRAPALQPLHSHSPEVGAPAGVREPTQGEAACQRVWVRRGARGGVLSAGEGCGRWGGGGDKPQTAREIGVPPGSRLPHRPQESRPVPSPRGSQRPPAMGRHCRPCLRPQRTRTHSKEVAADSHTSFSDAKSLSSPQANQATVVPFPGGAGGRGSARERPALLGRAPGGAVGLGAGPREQGWPPLERGAPTSGRRTSPLPCNLQVPKGALDAAQAIFYGKRGGRLQALPSTATPAATLPGPSSPAATRPLCLPSGPRGEVPRGWGPPGGRELAAGPEHSRQEGSGGKAAGAALPRRSSKARCHPQEARGRGL